MKTKNLVRELAVASIMAIAVLGLVLIPVLNSNAGLTVADGSKKSAGCAASCSLGKGVNATNANAASEGEPQIKFATAACAPGGCTASGPGGACTFSSALADATPTDLELIKQEIASDGQLYDDYALPEFDAFDLDGNKVKSADLAGQSTLLVLLASHCGHSIASLKILKDVADEYAGSDIRVVGVFINGDKDADKIKLLAGIYSDDYTIWTYPDAALGDIFKTHLAPSYFFVDASGFIKKKMIGMKNFDQLTKDVSGFLASVN